MTDKTALRARAVALMTEALDLLDRAGEDAAAIYLQQAHDIAARLTALRADDAADPDRRAQARATSLDPALVKAIGGALAVVGEVEALTLGKAVMLSSVAGAILDGKDEANNNVASLL